MYFGLGRDNALTLNEIGEELDLTRERIRQIKEKALMKLAHSQRIKKLEFDNKYYFKILFAYTLS